MIVVRVGFPTGRANLGELEEKMTETIPKYQGLDGLIRKYYVLSEDGTQAGGIYLWESRQKADAWYNPEWKQYMKDAWGEAPTLEYLDCPIVVDNATGEVITRKSS